MIPRLPCWNLKICLSSIVPKTPSLFFFASMIMASEIAVITPNDPSQSSETNSTNSNLAGKRTPPITPNTIRDSSFEFNQKIWLVIGYNIVANFFLVPKIITRKWLIYDEILNYVDLVLVDKKILAGGIALFIAGIIVANISPEEPAGQSGMSDEEIVDLLIAEDQNQAYEMLSMILFLVGFLLILISFGARRNKDTAKRKEKKPAE